MSLSGIFKRISLNIAVIEKSCAEAHRHTFLVSFLWLHFASNLSTSSYSFTSHCYQSIVGKDFSLNKYKLSTSSCYSVFSRKNLLLHPILLSLCRNECSTLQLSVKSISKLNSLFNTIKTRNFFLFENIKLLACS